MRNNEEVLLDLGDLMDALGAITGQDLSAVHAGEERGEKAPHKRRSRGGRRRRGGRGHGHAKGK